MPESPTFPLSSTVSYIVEEREVTKPNEVNYAWNFKSKTDAETMLLGQIRIHGKDRLYTSYICVD